MKAFLFAPREAPVPAAASARTSTAEASVRAEIGEIAAIEGLRGVAIAWVVLFHYLALRGALHGDPWNARVASHPWLDALVRHGYLGVDLFFLITGFLLVLPWERHRRLGLPAPDTRAFYARRIRRIVPAYYVQLAVVFLMLLPLLRALGAPPVGAKHVAATLVAHLGFLQYTTPITSAALGLNGALWTLALEAQYYLLLPLFAAAFVRAPLRWAAAFVAIAVAWHALASHGLNALVGFEMDLSRPWRVTEDRVRALLATQLPGYLAHFALGIVLGLAWMRTRGGTLPRAARIGSALACVAAAASLAAIFSGSWAPGPAWEWLATVALLAAVLQFPLVAAPPLGARVLGNAPLRALGRVSYSVYLYHVPVIVLWTAAGVLDDGAASMPACMAAIGGVAFLSYRFVERPFLRRRAREATFDTAAPRAA